MLSIASTTAIPGLRAAFPLAAVREIQELAPPGEFFVAVFYQSMTDPRMFKIKRRYLTKLELK